MNKDESTVLKLCFTGEDVSNFLSLCPIKRPCYYAPSAKLTIPQELLLCHIGQLVSFKWEDARIMSYDVKMSGEVYVGEECGMSLEVKSVTDDESVHLTIIRAQVGLVVLRDSVRYEIGYASLMIKIPYKIS